MPNGDDTVRRMKSAAENKTVRAAGRIGIGTMGAMTFVYFVDVPEGLHEAATGFIILVVNEVAYVGELVWKHFVKKLEEWA